MKLSIFVFLLTILLSFEARRITKVCPLTATTSTTSSTTTATTASSTPSTTTTVTPTTTTTTPTTTTSTTTTPTTTTTSTTTTPTTTSTTTTPTTSTTTTPASPIPGLGAAGNPVGMNTVTFKENVDIPANVISCSSSRFVPDSTGIWTFAQIADAFYEYGVKPWNFPNPTDRTKHIEDCVAALVIAAGECATPVGKVGCSTASGPSGVFQTDFLRTIPGFPVQDVMNLCLSSFGAGYMAAPYIAAAGKSCTVSVNGGAVASIYTCYQAPANINSYGTACADPQSDPTKTYPNFIGPFCHKAWASRWSSCAGTGPGCCALFNGGGNSYQVAFPQYYYDMSLTQGGLDYQAICKAASLLPAVA